MLRIDLAPLDEGIHHLSLSAEPEALDLDPDVFADVGAEVVLDYRKDQALVMLTATATATLECDRTLVPFEQPLEGQYSLLYASPAFARSAAGDDDTEVHVLDPADPVIDLTEAVRDTLLLAIPARKIAPGADDLELPTVFGEAEGDETAIDPRWEALRALRASGDDVSDD
ncbi:MAG: DUF177 domain-containing protein [Rhodothermales bacterium]|nr:DUF177 domain-containing protein [Rhodothermales bacterium]